MNWLMTKLKEYKVGVDEIMSRWFLLFDGTSCDGRGEPKFVGRTSHEKEALQHFKKVEKSRPYGIGKVMIVTDFTFDLANKESDII